MLSYISYISAIPIESTLVHDFQHVVTYIINDASLTLITTTLSLSPHARIELSTPQSGLLIAMQSLKHKTIRSCLVCGGLELVVHNTLCLWA
jgi:hypothetical protein